MVVQIRRGSGRQDPSLAPDFALSPRDIAFVAAYRRVDVTVHNIGALPARSFDLVLYHHDQETGRRVVPRIPAPESLLPSTLRLGFPLDPIAPHGRFRVVVDEAGRVSEIGENNNVAETELATPLATRARHAHP